MGLKRMRPGALMAVVLASAVASSACAAATQAASFGGPGSHRHAAHAAARGAAGSQGKRPAHATVRQASHGTAQRSAQSASRPGTVLVNQPAARVCLGKRFTVGVWFQQSGGSRAYRLSVYSPRHKRIFFRRGQAPSSHWAFWKIHATQAGKYHTVYSAHWRSATAWTRYRAATRAHRC